MKRNNQVKKPKNGTTKNIIIYTSIVLVFIIIYKLTADQKTNNGFSTVLFTGEVSTDQKQTPSKLRWFDSFKGIDNMGK